MLDIKRIDSHQDRNEPAVAFNLTPIAQSQFEIAHPLFTM
jgi:hypothetical protein